MCYNNCSYFHFNPMTGTDRCSKPSKATCPEELCGDCENHVDNCTCGEDEE